MGALHPAICLALVFFALAALGAWALRFLRAENNAALFFPLAGWGVYVFLAVALGTASPLGVMGSTVIVFFIAFFLSLLMLSRRRPLGGMLPLPFFGGLLLCLPLLLGASAITPHAWDDFSHWLPNALHLYSYGSFPAPGTETISSWPVYPYAFTLLQTCLSWAHGQFVESAGPLLNLALLALFASFCAGQLTKEPLKPMAQAALFALLFTSLILLHPGANEFFLFSAYSEYPTAVILALLGWLFWRLFSGAESRQSAILLAFLAVIFVQLRQANLYLLVIIVTSFSAIYWRLMRRWLLPLVLALLPATTTCLLWHFYTLGFGTQQGFAASGVFRLDLAVPLLAAMGEVILRKSGYFLMLAALLFLAMRRRMRPAGADGLLAATALASLLYFAFLFTAYLGSRFSDYEIRNAASFFRYMSHLHLAVFLALLLATAPKIASLVAALDRKPFPALAIVTGFILLQLATLQFGWLPHPTPAVTAMRDFAHSLHLPPEARPAALLPAFDGMPGLVLNYSWAAQAAGKAAPRLSASLSRFDAENNNSGTVLQDFASRHDLVIVGPGDSRAWEALGHTAQNRWAAFRKNGPGWVILETQ